MKVQPFRKPHFMSIFKGLSPVAAALSPASPPAREISSYNYHANMAHSSPWNQTTHPFYPLPSVGAKHAHEIDLWNTRHKFNDNLAADIQQQLGWAPHIHTRTPTISTTAYVLYHKL